MTKLEMDADGYPTEATIEAIKSWPIKDMKDCAELLARLQNLWRWESYFSKSQRRVHRHSRTSTVYWHVSTGGWSGHEEIVDALMGNRMFWMLTFMQHRRGGHYIFETP